ncbi:hypothetical protein KC909_02235 [Candidatus Dojkabacteria bacterium]|uniref:Uncharacterized protein n=1 Tax=Candidatus Dojkabacteria bacterium TaxID=2099670 RepID=A0A955RJ97_9BACT|nr:hypothetical protein [Candidatus Dojkabacteria bacterium]
MSENISPKLDQDIISARIEAGNFLDDIEANGGFDETRVAIILPACSSAKSLLYGSLNAALQELRAWNIPSTIFLGMNNGHRDNVLAHIPETHDDVTLYNTQVESIYPASFMQMVAHNEHNLVAMHQRFSPDNYGKKDVLFEMIEQLKALVRSSGYQFPRYTLFMDADSYFDNGQGRGIAQLIAEAQSYNGNAAVSGLSYDTAYSTDPFGIMQPDYNRPVSIFHHMANIQRQQGNQAHLIGNGFIVPSELVPVMGMVCNPDNQYVLPAEDSALSILASELGYDIHISEEVHVTNCAPELNDSRWIYQLQNWADVERTVMLTYDYEAAPQPSTVQRRTTMLAAAGRVLRQTAMHHDYSVFDGLEHILNRKDLHRRIFG